MKRVKALVDWTIAAIRRQAVALTLIALAVSVLRIWLNGKLPLYIHPATLWWVVSGGIVLMIIALMSRNVEGVNATKGQLIGIVVTTTVIFLTPNVSLSPSLAQQRDTGQILPTTSRTLVRPGGATQNFTILEWLAAWEGDPSRSRYLGAAADVTGFLTNRDGAWRLSRYLITCCAVDAQLVQLSLRAENIELPGAGTWVRVRGKIENAEGMPQVFVESVESVPEPASPYLY